MGIYNEYTKSWIKTESETKKRNRASRVLKLLKKRYPGSKTALKFGTPMQLLAAVILSAQTTDKKVNEVTQNHLFKKYRTAQDFAAAKLKVFEKEISQIGLYRGKARNILVAAKIIRQKFNGQLPETMNEMLALPGVGRKTASIVLWNAYGIIEGIAVDTHASRLSQRLGFSEADDAKKIEQDLMRLVPDKKLWPKINTLLVDHGRAICAARLPKCQMCPLNKLCPSSRS